MLQEGLCIWTSPSEPSLCSGVAPWYIARRLRAKIVLFRIQAWNFPQLLRLVSWWFLDIEPLQHISSAHAQGKIHFRYRSFGLTWLHRPVFVLEMVKNRPTISLDVLKGTNKYILKHFPWLRMHKLSNTSGYLYQWCQKGRNHWINGIFWLGNKCVSAQSFTQ